MSEITGNPVWDFTSARMSRPSSSPGPRNESLEERLALSKEDLKTMRARVSSPITFSLAAILRLWARDSMTHGPAKKRGAFPPPISYPGAIETVRESITRQDIGPPARSEALRLCRPLCALADVLLRQPGLSLLLLPRGAMRAGGTDEVLEERVADKRLGLELGVKLAAQEPGMAVSQLDEFDEFPGRW